MGRRSSWGDKVLQMVKKLFLKFLRAGMRGPDEITRLLVESEYPQDCSIYSHGKFWTRNGEASNVGQEDQGNKDDPILEPSIYKVRRFEMMKYLFDNDEACITINESKYLEHSKDSLDVIENSYVSLMMDGS
ncbi:hypothetical protein Tco_0535833 [Tanacetum coccineum]